MNKGILIKAGIILGFFAVTLGLAFGCSSIKDKNVTPQLENGEDVYLTVGDVTITNQDLWDMMKLSDGVNYLNQYLEEYLLADYIAALTDEEIATKVEEAIYGTNDAERIAKIQEDPDLEADMIEAFEQSLIIMGFDPNNDDDLRDYVELQVAKEKYTREFILAAGDGDSLEITEEDIEDYYTANVKGDVCALVIRFYSSDEANALFDENNLVPNYNEGFGKYFGTLPIEEVLTANFDETNTIQMTDEETFEEFLTLYNIMNPSDTPIPVDITLEDFCTTYADDFTFNFEDMNNNRSTSDPYVNLSKYLFNTLSLDEGDVRYSYTLQTIAEFKVLAFKVSQEEVTAFEDLTDADKLALKEEMVDDLITGNSVNVAMDALWDEYEFEVYEPVFKLQYEFNEDRIFENKGSSSLVATFGDMDITAQMLFDYMEQSLGTYYTIEIVKADKLINSEFYTEIYGESHDYMNSNNEKMMEHREELRNMKSIFSSDGYAAYGFSSASFTWEEFLIIAFGSYTEADVIRDLFVIGTLQPYLVRDMIAYENAATVIQSAVDDYFNLDAEHLLAYVDFDFDFSGDEFNGYVDDLTGDALTEYNAITVDLEQLIQSKLDDDYTFKQIVDEYNKSLINDPENEWAPFKEYGFFLVTQVLSSSNSLTPSTTTNYDEDFVLALKRIYDSYVTLVENSIEAPDEYVDDRLVQTNFGLHWIIATEGDGFEQPSAVYPDDPDGDNSPGSIGTTVAPNQSQVDLYIEIRFAETVGETTEEQLPNSVYDAIDAYYGDVYDAYFTTSGYSIATTEFILASNPQFATNQADRIAFLESVVEILYQVNFPEGFDPEAN